MEAPKPGLSPADLNAAIKALFQRYQDTNGGWICGECRAKVQFVRCYVSIHDTPPGGVCAGMGEVKDFLLPYCPQCEGEPKSKSTCLHIGTGRLIKAFGGLLEDVGQLELT